MQALRLSLSVALLDFIQFLIRQMRIQAGAAADVTVPGQRLGELEFPEACKAMVTK